MNSTLGLWNDYLIAATAAGVATAAGQATAARLAPVGCFPFMMGLSGF